MLRNVVSSETLDLRSRIRVRACIGYVFDFPCPQREKLNSDRCIYAYAIWILLGIEKQSMED